MHMCAKAALITLINCLCK